MVYRNLNSEQNKAVEHLDGPVLILAGAGSGKTQTMTHRMAYMISQGVNPYNILAVTFTNKAAGEMRDRVASLVGDTQGMWIMTFHALCLRLLRFDADLLGFKSNFTVYDETDKKSLIKKIEKELEIDEKAYKVSSVVAAISNAKENEEKPEEVSNPIVGKIFARYNEILKSNNAMDFDDLLLNGVKLLEQNPRVLEKYAERFKYIMVDEYQDTNYLQYKLIKMLASKHNNLCVVGDDDQCIYEWRGADIRNILDFERDFKHVFTVKLEQNYRSHANILNLANSVIKNNKGRKQKKLWTDAEDGEKITYRRLADEKEEAWFIATEIERLHEAGYKYSDMAILYRKNIQSRPFEEKFSFRKIPYRVLAGMRYYDRKEIKDVMSYLRLIENPDDDVSMVRVINEPKRGIGPKTLAGIENYASVNKCSIYQALCQEEVRATLGAKSKEAIEKMVEMIQDIRGEIENLRILDIYENILERSGYLADLEATHTVEADARIENIMEFKSVVDEYDKKTPELEEYQTPLGAFLEGITLMAEVDNHDENEDAVVLMTLHSAKGLEFPIVFIPGMENGMFPGNSAYDNPDKMEEERRLCYVGITRAMRKLYLTAATYRMLYGKSDYTTESSFLEEMDRDCMDGDELMKERSEKFAGLHDDGGYLGNMFFGGRTMGTVDGYAGKPAAKPFAQDEFEIGDTLLHPKFGEGLLIAQDEKTMTIMFDNFGEKKLGKGFVKLERID